MQQEPLIGFLEEIDGGFLQQSKSYGCEIGMLPVYLVWPFVQWDRDSFINKSFRLFRKEASIQFQGSFDTRAGQNDCDNVLQIVG